MIFGKRINKKDDVAKEQQKAPEQKNQMSPSDYCSDGEKFFVAKKYSQAMEYFQAAIEGNPQGEDGYVWLSKVYVALGKIDLAKSTLYRLLALDPENKKALDEIEVLVYQNRHSSAKETVSSPSAPLPQQSSSLSSTNQSPRPLSASHSYNGQQYCVFPGTNQTAFDFFIMFDDGNRVYFKKNDSGGLTVVAPHLIGIYTGRGWEGFISPENELIIPEQIDFESKSYLVNEVGNNAFSICRKLVKITLPNTIERIGCGVFVGCDQLVYVYLPDAIREIGTNAFKWCRSLESVMLPDSLTKMSSGLFEGCGKLKSITIPYNVTSIGVDALNLWSPYSEINIKMLGNPPKCENNPFGHSQPIVHVTVPKGLLNEYMIAPYWQCFDLKEENDLEQIAYCHKASH